jgi:hypothetical protein
VNAFHLIAAIYLLVCAAIGGAVGASRGWGVALGAVAGAGAGAIGAEALRRLVLWSLPPMRPPCGCGKTDFQMAAFRFEGTTEIREEGVTLQEEGSLWRCECGRLYFQTPRRFLASTRFLAQSEDSAFRSYMRSTRILGWWVPDATPAPPRGPYRT